MANFPELKGRNILITGGANGIGAATIHAFHQQCARVFFCDTDARAGQNLVTALGKEIHFQKVDLQKEAEIRRWITGIGKTWKRIDVLVNNAAIDPRIPLEKTSSRNWDRLFAINLRAYFLACREAQKFMGEGSSIVNFASITFHAGPTNMSAYVATKGGVIGFTRALARELGPRRIRVNTLSPGWVMTERQLRQFVTPAVKKLINRSQAIPDRIQPPEIADVVLFLSSQGSRAITGQEILVDRGWHHS